MRYTVLYDKKLLILLVLLLMLVISIGVIWRHYDLELKTIENQKEELKLRLN